MTDTLSLNQFTDKLKNYEALKALEGAGIAVTEVYELYLCYSPMERFRAELMRFDERSRSFTKDAKALEVAAAKLHDLASLGQRFTSALGTSPSGDLFDEAILLTHAEFLTRCALRLRFLFSRRRGKRGAWPAVHESHFRLEWDDLAHARSGRHLDALGAKVFAASFGSNIDTDSFRAMRQRDERDYRAWEDSFRR